MELNQPIKADSYYTIHAFMVNDLHLKGAEKEIYAIIYSYTKSDAKYFEGSISHLQKWLSCSKQTVITALNNLVDKNYILKDKSEHKRKCNRYIALNYSKTSTENTNKLESYNEILQLHCSEAICIDAWQNYLKLRAMRKNHLTNQALMDLITKLDFQLHFDELSIANHINDCVMRGEINLLKAS